LLAGYLPLLIGIKTSFILVQFASTFGFIMLLISGNPIWLLTAMFLIGIGKGGITNYNNLLISLYSGGSAGPLNILHASFASGAVIAPLIVLVVSGWKMAVITGCIVGASSLIFLAMAGFSDKDLDTADSTGGNNKKKVDYGFLREKIFWVTVLIVFFYQAVEASLMGWLTSFLIDTGLMADSLAQFATSVLWMALLAGRLFCSFAASRFKPSHMIMALTCVTLIFMILLLKINSPAGLIIATAGIGLGMSGMSGTSVSNAGDIFSRYPVCMGFYVFLTSMGAIVAPAVIGLVANTAGIYTGMSTLMIFAGCMIAMAVVNVVMQRKR
ncbi:MAG: MFS transporter, partial [Lachnospiraceae bacterium]